MYIKFLFSDRHAQLIDKEGLRIGFMHTNLCLQKVSMFDSLQTFNLEVNKYNKKSYERITDN